MTSLLFHFLLLSVICQQLLFFCLGEENFNLKARESDWLSSVLSRKSRDTDDANQLQYFLQGPPGVNGLNGLNGRDGRDCVCFGSEGLKGEKGEPGDDGVSPTGAPSSLTSCIRKMGTNNMSRYRRAYLRGHPGGGAEYLCLPLDPIYDQFEAGIQNQRAYMCGAEYEVSAAIFGGYDSLHDHDVPCAVCLAPRGTLLNIPARNVCPSGWVLEYSGYLMAAKFDQPSPKKHICVDKTPETRDGTSSNMNGAVLFFVEGRCGSLPCSPYVEGSELTCAVCSI